VHRRPLVVEKERINFDEQRLAEIRRRSRLGTSRSDRREAVVEPLGKESREYLKNIPKDRVSAIGEPRAG
jgi:hypothetical protein